MAGLELVHVLRHGTGNAYAMVEMLENDILVLVFVL